MYWLEQLTRQIVRVDVQDDCSDKLNNNNKATEKQDNKTALEAIRNEIMFLKSKIESLHSQWLGHLDVNHVFWGGGHS